MLYLINGASGSGKTTFIYQKIKQLSEENKKVLFVVPEQFSFETEKSIYSLLGVKASVNVEVCSFTRLAKKIFDEFGGNAGNFINDISKTVIMNMALVEIKDSLKCYKKNIKNIGFAKSMLDMISDLKKSGITPEYLDSKLDSVENAPLKEKLYEIMLIYSAYQTILQKKYIDEQDNLTRATAQIVNKNFFSEYTVFFDEFVSFTPVQMEMISQILASSEDTYFSFCIDSFSNISNYHSLFSPSLKTQNRLIVRAGIQNIKVSPIIRLDNNYKAKNEDLAHLQNNILRNNPVKFEGELKNIKLIKAENEFDEIDYVACTIKHLVSKNGYRYNDIVVISRNVEVYDHIIQNVFEKRNIPFFCDMRFEILNKPIIKLCLGILNVASTNFNTDELFKLLKCGISKFDMQTICELENYVYMWDINNDGWINEFSANPNGFSEKFGDEEKLLLERINEIRAFYVEPIYNFMFKSKNETSKNITALLYETLKKLETVECIEQLLKTADTNEQQQISSIWDALNNLLEMIAFSCGESQMEIKRYAELFNIGIGSIDLGTIPQVQDCVTFANAQRFRANNKKVAFLLGVNEGDFPFIPSSNGLLTKNQKKYLSEIDLEIGKTIDEQIVEEYFIAYKAIASSQEQVFFTSRIADISGKICESSIIEKELIYMFGEQVVGYASELEKAYFCIDESSVFSSLAMEYQNDTELRATLIDILEQSPKFKSKLELLKKGEAKRQFQIQDKQIATKLFGENMHLSATKIEKYNNCNFAYFCSDGLKLKERKKADLDPLETGSLMHHLLYKITTLADFDLICDDKKRLENEIKTILMQYIELKMPTHKNDSRFSFLFSRIVETALKIVLHISNEFKQSKFKPVDFEKRIEPNSDIPPLVLQTPDNKKVFVEGVIDRVDLCEINGEKYCRIVDYKTGSKFFNLSDVYYGLNMQMMVYLFTIWQNGEQKYKDVIPAGVLYMPASTPSPKLSRHSTYEQVNFEIAKQYTMNGLLLENEAVLSAMDNEFSGAFIPVRKTKTGEFNKTAPLVSLEQMGKLSKYIDKLIVDMSVCLRDGIIEAVPSNGCNYDSCAYCSFTSVCAKNDNLIKKIEKLSTQELFEKIEQQENSI